MLFEQHQIRKVKVGGFDIDGVLRGKYVSIDKSKVVVIKPNKEGLKGDRRNTKVSFQVKSHDKIVAPDIDPNEAKRPVKVSGELKALVGAQRFTLGNGMEVVVA